MSVILLILKIIGILLLCLFGILLLLILLVLFSPVRYIVNGRIDDKKKIYGNIHWLWPILSIPFSYEHGEFFYEFRIFGIRRKKKRRAAENEDFFEEDGGNFEDEVQNHGAVEEITKEHEGGEELPQGQEAKSKKTEETDALGDTTESGLPDLPDPDRKEVPETENSPALGRRNGNPISRLWKRIRICFDKWKKSVRKFLYTVTHLRGQAADIKKLIIEETNKKVFGFGVQELKYLLRHFRFRKVKIDLSYSLGDPSYTGQILGVLCLFPVLYRYDVHIKPDFEAEQIYVLGTFYLKGHMRAAHFAAALFRLWKKKEVRTLIKSVFHKN